MGDTERGQWVNFTAYSLCQTIVGRLHCVHLRFTDALTLPTSDFIAIEDCTVTPTGSTSVSQGQPGRVLIDRRNLVFAIPGPEPSFEAAGRRELRVPKVAYPVAFAIADWHVSGQLHLPPWTAPEEAITALRDPFVPITAAIATRASNPEPRLNAEVILLNRAWITAFWPLGAPR